MNTESPMLFFPNKRPEPRVPEEPAQEQEWEVWYAVAAFVELGLGEPEAFALTVQGVSPSLIREFCKHHPDCDVRTAVAIHL